MDELLCDRTDLVSKQAQVSLDPGLVWDTNVIEMKVTSSVVWKKKNLKFSWYENTNGWHFQTSSILRIHLQPISQTLPLRIDAHIKI